MTHRPLHIEAFSLGMFETNCYVVHRVDAEGNVAAEAPCWVIDPGMSPGEVIDYINEKGLRPVAVVLTHAHCDHILGVGDVLRAFKPAGGGDSLPILLNEAEHSWPTDPRLNLSWQFGMPFEGPAPTDTLEHGQTLEIDGFAFEVRHTPGHSPGSVSLVNHEHGVVIAGDTLFRRSVGRSDFPGSDPATLMRSIREQLFTLADETIVYPGHYDPTTIGEEKRENPYVGDAAMGSA